MLHVVYQFLKNGSFLTMACLYERPEENPRAATLEERLLVFCIVMTADGMFTSCTGDFFVRSASLRLIILK